VDLGIDRDPAVVETLDQVALPQRTVPIEQCPVLGDTGDIMLCDFSKYVAIDKGGMQQDASIHVRFIYDETTFRWVFRCDGQPLWNSSLTPYKGSGNTQSPFITLQTR